MSVLYVGAGVLHFVATRRYMAIMPDYLPAHRALVLVSGAAEVAGGLGVLAPNAMVRRSAAWGLVLLLIAVMPANIYMVTDHAKFAGVPLWVVWLRLPLQLPLLYWAWLYTRPEGIGHGGIQKF
jgi:uncharacterized membrane protein